jgi:hypothetical protein
VAAAATCGQEWVGRRVTEAELNGGRRDPSEARLLVVCSKYETGYVSQRRLGRAAARVSAGRAVAPAPQR